MGHSVLINIFFDLFNFNQKFRIAQLENYSRQWRLLINDIKKSFFAWRFWTHLGWTDILKQYRRSLVGPLWIVLNTAIFIVGFGFIGAQLFKFSLKEYLPYFCVGHVFFAYFSSLMTEGCLAFTSSDAFLKQTPYPKITFVLRVVWRNSIMLAHNLIVVVGVLFWADRLSIIVWPLFFLGFFFTTVVAILAISVLALAATRFRDIPMIVSSGMQLVFFVTPVIWRPEQLTANAQWVVLLNPFATLLELVRAPLLGNVVSANTWQISFGILAILVPIFLISYLFARRRIVYWL